MTGLAFSAGTSLAAAGGASAPAPLTYVPAAYQMLPQPDVWPVPQRAVYPSGILPLASLRLETVGNAPQIGYAVRDLQDELKVRFGTTLPVFNVTRLATAESGAAGAVDLGREESGSTRPGAAKPLPLIIGTRADAALAAKADAAGLKVTHPEGYALHVGPDGAWIVGADPQGAYWGVQTLRQLLAVDPAGFRYADIADWPAFPLRMAMIYLDAYSRGINDRLIPILAQYKFNTVLIMCDYVQWDSTPNIWNPQGASKAEARRVAELIRSYGMEPVPLIELLGHVQWMFYNGQNQDLYQDPEASEPFAYDTLNPRTYAVVEAVLQEAVDVFKPRWVHIGHDEVRNVNRFPARPNGKALGFERLFYDDVVRLHDFLKSRGVATMMWQDVVFSGATLPLARELPKDIVFTDWHYTAAEDYPSIRQIRSYGFQVVGASWDGEDNPETFARSALRDGALGMLQTRWTGYFGNPSIVDGQAQQAIAYLRAGAAFWNPDVARAREEAMAVSAPARYYDAWLPTPYRPIPGRLVNLSGYATRSLVDPGDSGWIGKGPDYDLSGLMPPRGTTTVRLGPYLFHISGAVMTRADRGVARSLPARVTIPLHAKAAALAALNTTAWAAPADGMPVGRYVLTYAGGSTLAVPLTYQRQIAAWTDPVLKSLVRYPAWRGTARSGLPVGADVFVIRNPHPEEEIASFTVESAGNDANPTMLGLTLLDAAPVPKEVTP
ncbi:MAG: beta-N-acetylhexosaminidase [Firmicutes bacterium]|nr:beta-N-acetylhexosaminidase [Bacillota bacterium]